MTLGLMAADSAPHSQTLSATPGPIVDVPPVAEAMDDAVPLLKAMSMAPPCPQGLHQTLSVTPVSKVVHSSDSMHCNSHSLLADLGLTVWGLTASGSAAAPHIHAPSYSPPP